MALNYNIECLGILIKNSLLATFIPLQILMALHVITDRAITESARQFQLDLTSTLSLDFNVILVLKWL